MGKGKEKAFTCLICTKQFKKQINFDKTEEREHERKHAFVILCQLLEIPSHERNVAEGQFNFKKESLYCRKCASWFQNIVSYNEQKEALEGNILKLQKSLLQKLKKLSDVMAGIKSNLKNVKDKVIQTDEERAQQDEVKPNLKTLFFSKTPQKLEDRIIMIRRMIINPGTEIPFASIQDVHFINTESNDDLSHDNSEESSSLINGYPQNFIVPVEVMMTETEQYNNDEDFSNYSKFETTETNTSTTHSNFKIKIEPMEIVDCQVKDEPESQNDSEDSDLNDMNLNNFQCLSSDEEFDGHQQCEDENLRTASEDEDNEEEVATVRRPRRSTANTKSNKIKKTSVYAESTDSSDESEKDNESDVEWNIEFHDEDTFRSIAKQERIQGKLDERDKREAEFFVKYDEIVGKLESTEDPWKVKYKEVEIYIKGKDFECSICKTKKGPAKNISARWATRHIREHVALNHLGGFECDLCSSAGKKRLYKSYRLIEAHLQRHKQIIIECPICKKPFKETSPNNYNWHKWSHKNEEEKQEAISKGVKPPADCSKSKQKPKRKHLCSQCGKGFPSLFSLQLHEEIHLDKEEREKLKIPCAECGLMCLRNSLNYHINSVHRKIVDVKRHECSICKKIFPTEPRLKLHIQSIHEKQKRYTCKVCDKGFFSKFAMQNHTFSHSDDKNFSCDLCSSSFKYGRNLQRHKATCHNNNN